MRPSCEVLDIFQQNAARHVHIVYYHLTAVCVFHDVCDFVSNLIATDRSQEIVRQKTYVWCKQGLTRREPTFCRALEKMWCTLQCERAFLMTWRIKVESAYIDVSKQMGSCFQDTSCKGTALKKSCNLNCCIQSLFSFLIEVSVRPGGPEPRNGEILLRFTVRASVA